MARPPHTARRVSAGLGLAVASWFVLTAAPAGGQTRPDPRQANPERPTVATHAYAVAPGIVELESGVQWQSLGAGNNQLTAPFLFKMGLGRHVQLDVAPGLAGVETNGTRRGGLSDSAVGFKWQVAAGVPILSDVGVEALLKLPTGDRALGTGTGTTDLSLVFISSRQIGRVELDVNVGYTRRSGDGTFAPTTATLWTVSTGFPVVGPLGWTAELFGYPGTSGPAGAGPIVAFLTGPTFQPQRSIVLDAGLILNVEGFGATAFYAGVTWNIGRLPGIGRPAQGRVAGMTGQLATGLSAGPSGRR